MAESNDPRTQMLRMVREAVEEIAAKAIPANERADYVERVVEWYAGRIDSGAVQILPEVYTSPEVRLLWVTELKAALEARQADFAELVRQLRANAASLN